MSVFIIHAMCCRPCNAFCKSCMWLLHKRRAAGMAGGNPQCKAAYQAAGASPPDFAVALLLQLEGCCYVCVCPHVALGDVL
jgi:hypothetical protein